MKTAKTIQLLDANNTNISPAVCIESLYFEQTSGANTYRISLKNRTVIASNNIITKNPSMNNDSNDILSMTVPYVYVKKISSESSFNVCELNTGDFNIGRRLSNCVSTWCNTNFYNKQKASEKFIRMDENDLEFPFVNRTNGFYCGTSDASLHIYDASGPGRLSWQNGSTYIGVDKVNGIDSLNITANGTNSITLDTESNKIAFMTDNVDIFAPTGMKVDVGNSSLSFSKVDIESVSYVNVASGMNGNINVSSGNDIVLRSTGDIRINPAYDEDNVTNVYLYDYRLERPSVDIDPEEHRIYALTLGANSSVMTWNKFPKLYLNSFGKRDMETFDVLADNIENTSLYTRGLVFYSDYNDASILPDASRIQILYNDKNEGSNTIGFRGFKSGNVKKTLLAVPGNDATVDDLVDNKFVNLCTINDQSLLGKSNIEVLTQEDLNGHHKITFVRNPIENNTFSIVGAYMTEFDKLSNMDASDSGRLFYMSRIYFRTNDCVYATGYYASSDERLKDNIEDVPSYEIENVPSIKQFNWKSDDRKSYGFIAQELMESGHEELVSEDPDGMFRVDYNAALSLKCAQLEEQNRKLSNRVARLESLVDKLLDEKK